MDVDVLVPMVDPMIEIDGDVARIAASCVGGLSCVPLIA
jgi:hypothetical protein